jgi:hypothetical protein
MLSSPLANRRDFVRVSGVTLAASALELLGAPALGADDRKAVADQVLFLWLPGGVTHHESFDPKPDAPSEIRGDIKPIETSVPGIRFAEVMPKLARHADKIALIRSYRSGNDDHFLAQAFALSGKTNLPGGILSEPNFGCIVAHQLGPTGGLPAYIAVPGSTRPGPPNTNEFVPAWLGAKYSPFCTGGEPRHTDFRVENLGLSPEIGAQRFWQRQSLREQIEASLGKVERNALRADMANLYGKAAELLTSPKVREAFDVHAEPKTAREKYGETKLGIRCLLARRLIEADARFVMVDYGYDWGEYNNLWDNHCAPVQNQPPIFKMCKVPYHLPAVDRAFAALLDDLAQSGRLKRTLVVYLTEFGRTPKVNSNGGRDHWGHAGSIFFAGAGVKGGQVLGATDKQGGYCTTRTFSPSDAVATVYRTLGIDPHATIQDREGRPVPIQAAGEAIRVF